MSYVVSVWEQPAGVPLPRGFDEAGKLLSELHGLPSMTSTKMSMLAQRLGRHFPGRDEDDCVWTDGPMAMEAAQGPVWNIGIFTGDRLEDVQVMVVAEAVKLGLNVEDGQAGELHLSDGSVHSLSERGYCVSGMAATLTRDYLTARNEFRGLAARGNRFAHFRWGELFLNGMGVPKDRAAGCALVCAGAGWRVDAQGQVLAPTDPEQRQIGDRIRQAVGPESVMRADALLRKVGPDRSIATVIDELMLVRAQVARQVKTSVARPQTEPVDPPSPPKAKTATTVETSTRPPASPASPAIMSLMLGLGLHGAMFTFPDRGTFIALSLGAAIFGCHGVWRSTASLAYPRARRLLPTVGAGFPMLGLIPCAAVLWQCIAPPPR